MNIVLDESILIDEYIYRLGAILLCLAVPFIGLLQQVRNSTSTRHSDYYHIIVSIVIVNT